MVDTSPENSQNGTICTAFCLILFAATGLGIFVLSMIIVINNKELMAYCIPGFLLSFLLFSIGSLNLTCWNESAINKPNGILCALAFVEGICAAIQIGFSFMMLAWDGIVCGELEISGKPCSDTIKNPLIASMVFGVLAVNLSCYICVISATKTPRNNEAEPPTVPVQSDDCPSVN